MDKSHPGVCTIHPSPGGFPRGRPALILPRRSRLSGMTHPDIAADALVCSARGCRAPARWVLRWNNPRLHTPERRKTWLACATHRPSLGEFLDARGFLREVAPLAGSPTLEEWTRTTESQPGERED
ncbi:hypothetical protein Vwe01_43090 [Micromonospora andamanensis]|nr:hypothetical protein Vwe01_43090 [Micromonospora andamanensis]